LRAGSDDFEELIELIGSGAGEDDVEEEEEEEDGAVTAR